MELLILSVFMFISAVPVPTVQLYFFPPPLQQQLWEKAELNKSSQPYQFSAGSCHDWTPVALPGRLCMCVWLCVCVVVALLYMVTKRM